MLKTSKEMILSAQKGGYAVGAFNVENMEMAQAVIAAAEDMGSPVILQTTPSTIKYGGFKLFGKMLGTLAKDAKIPAAVHLDHGADFDMAARALGAGYTSVMIDGSRLDFEENISLTKRVADLCRSFEIPAEAELGKVGGKEDDLESFGPGYTDPTEAVEFARRTGIFSLAIGIGTSHGIYSGLPKLDIPRIKLIAEKIENPLVLHGTSGIPDEDVYACIKNGICKVNYATELRVEFTRGVKEALAASPDIFDPKFYLSEGRKRVCETVKLRIKICGSNSK